MIPEYRPLDWSQPVQTSLELQRWLQCSAAKLKHIARQFPDQCVKYHDGLWVIKTEDVPAVPLSGLCVEKKG